MLAKLRIYTFFFMAKRNAWNICFGQNIKEQNKFEGDSDTQRVSLQSLNFVSDN